MDTLSDMLIDLVNRKATVLSQRDQELIGSVAQFLAVWEHAQVYGEAPRENYNEQLEHLRGL